MAFALTAAGLRAHLRATNAGYPFALELNEVLHLNHKGIQTIENLDCVPNLNTLYLEGNGIEDLENFESTPHIRCLFLARNYVEDMAPGLAPLKELRQLDLSDNRIAFVDGLAELPVLETLMLRGNKLADADSIRHLAACPSLRSVDVSKNAIDGGQDVVDVLTSLSRLSLLRAFENPFVKQVKGYRKTLLGTMQWLNYLDDAPAFDKDKRCAAAWLRGGVEAERAERDAVRAEEEETRRKNRERFHQIVAEAEARAARGEVEPVDPYRFRPHERGVHPLDTYDSDDDLDPIAAQAVDNHYRAKGLEPPVRRRQSRRHPQAPQAAVAAGGEAGDDVVPDLPSPAAARDAGDDGKWTLLSKPESDDPPAAAAGAAVELREEAVDLGPSPAPRSGPPPPPPPPPTEEELERRAAARAALAAREAAFRQQLHDEALRRAAQRTARRAEAGYRAKEAKADAQAAESAGESRVPRMGEFRIPQVWGTDRYASLWEKAKQVGEWQEEHGEATEPAEEQEEEEEADAQPPSGLDELGVDDGDDDDDDDDADPMERYSVKTEAPAATSDVYGMD